MTALTTFLDTYWWIIPLVMMGLCFLTMRKGGMCAGWWEANERMEPLLTCWTGGSQKEVREK